MPSHIVAKDESDNVLGVVPLYLKRFCIFYAAHTANSYLPCSTILLTIQF
jgi:hypothetical protein